MDRMIQDMHMACPPDWHDKSMLIFSAKQAGSSGVIPNMVVTRDVLPPDLPPEDDGRMAILLDRQVERMRDQLAGFAEVSRRTEPGGKQAEIKVDWRSAQAELTQSITFVDAGKDGLMIATATAGRGEFADAEPLFRTMLQSFRIG